MTTLLNTKVELFLERPAFLLLSDAFGRRLRSLGMRDFAPDPRRPRADPSFVDASLGDTEMDSRRSFPALGLHRGDDARGSQYLTRTMDEWDLTN